VGSKRVARRARAARGASPGIPLLALLILGLAFAAVRPLGAQTAEREVVLRFLPPPGEVEGYRVLLTHEATLLGAAIDVRRVAPDADGVGRVAVALDAAAYLARMTAYNAAGESAPSNQIRVAAACEAEPCDDANACTADTCDSSGCSQTPLEDGSPCDDGSSATQADRCVAGSCVGALASLALDAVVPAVVRPGSSDLLIQGLGFANGTALHFENGGGKTPRVRSVSLIDSRTLQARIDVRAQRPARTRFWDVVVSLPDGRSARLVGGLRVDP